MSEPRAPKKSETLEIRIPYPTKTAFMEKARAEGKAASEIVRERIDAHAPLGEGLFVNGQHARIQACGEFGAPGHEP